MNRTTTIREHIINFILGFLSELSLIGIIIIIAICIAGIIRFI
ncbi:MAG: hypothetical protein ABH886_11210 [Candidatus Desantisbacteria bacterium]